MRLRRLDGALPTLFGGDATGQAEADAEITSPELESLLRSQVQARQDLGAPLPPNLLVWIAG